MGWVGYALALAGGARAQTDPAWRHRFGLQRATVLWGLDIGTTLSTIKTTSFY